MRLGIFSCQSSIARERMGTNWCQFGLGLVHFVGWIWLDCSGARLLIFTIYLVFGGMLLNEQSSEEMALKVYRNLWRLQCLN